jgi:hypothetical protein
MRWEYTKSSFTKQYDSYAILNTSSNSSITGIFATGQSAWNVNTSPTFSMITMMFDGNQGSSNNWITWYWNGLTLSSTSSVVAGWDPNEAANFFFNSKISPNTPYIPATVSGWVGGYRFPRAHWQDNLFFWSSTMSQSVIRQYLWNNSNPLCDYSSYFPGSIYWNFNGADPYTSVSGGPITLISEGAGVYPAPTISTTHSVPCVNNLTTNEFVVWAGATGCDIGNSYPVRGVYQDTAGTPPSGTMSIWTLPNIGQESEFYLGMTFSDTPDLQYPILFGLYFAFTLSTTPGSGILYEMSGYNLGATYSLGDVCP